MKKIASIVCVLGIIMVIIGVSLPHETELRSYKDDKGGTVMYLGDKLNVLDTFGCLMAIGGGVGMWLFSGDGKDDKK